MAIIDKTFINAFQAFEKSHKDVRVTVDRDFETLSHRIKMEKNGYEYIYRFDDGYRISPSIFDIMYRSFMNSIAKDDESKHIIVVEELEPKEKDNWYEKLKRQVESDIDSTE